MECLYSLGNFFQLKIFNYLYLKFRMFINKFNHLFLISIEKILSFEHLI